MTTEGRKIIHLDMDAFYASVEQRDRPELRGRPVIVGGDPSKRGVVASCSYEARRFGVRSAMSSRKAQEICPRAVFVRPEMAKYKEASRQIRIIFHEVTDLVEPLSLDEAYLDVTVNKLGEPLARKVAEWLRSSIRERLQLTASAGVGPNKFIAKIASDMRKPDGLMVVAPPQVTSFVEKLPVEKLWGVGPATARKLKSLGMETAADIRRVPLAEMERLFGKFGPFLHGLSHGLDDRPVDTDDTPKSRGAETTFEKDLTDLKQLSAELGELAIEVSVALKKRSLSGRTLTLKVRYKDFTTVTRSRTLPEVLEEARGIHQLADLLMRESTEAGRIPIRLLGISVSNLQHPGDEKQLHFEL